MKLNKSLQLYEWITVKGSSEEIVRADHFYQEKYSVYYTKSYKIEQSHITLEIKVSLR